MHGQGNIPKTILVFRALKLGDMLCSIPALRSLRRAYPEARISLLTLPVMEHLMLRFRHYVDEVIPFPGWPGMPEKKYDPVEVVNFLTRIQGREFDLAIQLHGAGEVSNPFLTLVNARTTVGYYREGNFCPDPLHFRVYPEDQSEVHRCLKLLEVLGIENGEEHLEFPLWEEDFHPLNKLEVRPKQYVCLHPGASTVSKRWSPGSFARVGDHLASHGHQVVFTGSSFESGLIAEIQQKMKYPSVDTSYLDLPLGPLGALIKGSAGLVCNDTGVSHLASALQVPSIVIFTETDPARWAPLNRELHHSLKGPGVEDVLLSVNRRLLVESEVQ